jgi:hypothetical protein
MRRRGRRLNKDDRTLEMPEDPAIGAAFQQHKLRRFVLCSLARSHAFAP